MSSLLPDSVVAIPAYQLNGIVSNVYESGNKHYVQLTCHVINDDGSFYVDILTLETEYPLYFMQHIEKLVTLAVRPYYHKQSKQVRFELVNQSLFNSQDELHGKHVE